MAKSTALECPERFLEAGDGLGRRERGEIGRCPARSMHETCLGQGGSGDIRAIRCIPPPHQEQQTFLGVRSRVRLELATAALAETDATIDSVAARVGFNSRSHFVRWFSGETGETPSAYRRARHALTESRRTPH